MSNAWRVGGKEGRTLYKDERMVGVMDTPELAAAAVAALSAPTRVDAARPRSFPPASPKTLPGMLAVDVERRTPPPRRGRTESAARESLMLHHRRVAAEEAVSISAYEADIIRMRRDPKIVRYIEAEQELAASVLRRDAALRDLGLLVAEGKVAP